MSTEAVEACAALQDDEIAVLDSIYPDLIFTHPNPSSKAGRLLTLTLPITILADLSTVLIVPSSQPSSSSVLPTLALTNLPPLTFRVFLPPSYPLANPPKPVALKAPIPTQNATQTSWLSKTCLSKAQEMLVGMWEEERAAGGEGVGVLWKWWEWVGSGDFLEQLDLMKDGQLSLPVPPTIPPSTFHTILKTYNAQQLHSSFKNTAFSCSICFENRKGKSCVQMPGCDCVFCHPCLSACWSLAIDEGTIENVACPSVDCVKRRATREKPTGAQASSSKEETDTALVESVVGRELRERWQDLKEKRIAEIGKITCRRAVSRSSPADPTYTVCPQPFCQATVPPPPPASNVEPGGQAAIPSRVIRLSDLSSPPSNPSSANSYMSASPTPPKANHSVEDRWARFRTCPKCQFHFCLYCSATWHGPHPSCAFPQTSIIVQEYLSYTEDSEGRRRMEARRGKANLERMVAKWREDEENKKWLQSRTRACAGCGVRVDKSHGCNHMTCGRCNSHFCYRCGESISPQDPYSHYRRPDHACFERLFDQEEIARYERETAMGVAGLQMGEEADGNEWRDVRGFWEW